MTVTAKDAAPQTPTLRLKKTVTQKSKYDRVPTEKPTFTVGDIRRAIPAHCFERSLVTSFSYLLVDLVLVAVAMYLATRIDPFCNQFSGFAGYVLRSACWVAYWCFCGSVMTGLWVIGHECGHGGFADSGLINDTVGWVIHSFLLVPFFSWKISHRRHHSNTGNLDNDEVFVPTVNSSTITADTNGHSNSNHKHDDDSDRAPVFQCGEAILRCIRIVLMLTLGWPLYLLNNNTGNTTYPKNSFVNHFFPNSPIFTSRKESLQVLLSDIGLLIVGYIYSQIVSLVGFKLFAMVFGVPYLITNLFLVLITFLQHTDHVLPHYSGGEWDWLRGALATVDRDYGLLNKFHHHIADTHVVHHLFSNMPHYHAQEATKAVIPLLGKYYRHDATPVAVALWRSFGECNVVDADPAKKGIYWFN